jgi:transposase
LERLVRARGEAPWLSATREDLLGPAACWAGRAARRRRRAQHADLAGPSEEYGPTDAINGRLEHLRGSALGFRNLTNYIARSYSKPADSDRDYTLDHEEPVQWRE